MTHLTLALKRRRAESDHRSERAHGGGNRRIADCGFSAPRSGIVQQRDPGLEAMPACLPRHTVGQS